MDTQEITDMLIHALDNSQAGFKSFKEVFAQCSAAFELGNDQEGIKLLSSILSPIKDFTSFCAEITRTHGQSIPPEIFGEFEQQCSTFKDLITDMLEEMEEGNYVEVGDILKYDLGDLIDAMSVTFPKISNSLKNPSS